MFELWVVRTVDVWHDERHLLPALFCRRRRTYLAMDRSSGVCSSEQFACCEGIGQYE